MIITCCFFSKHECVNVMLAFYRAISVDGITCVVCRACIKYNPNFFRDRIRAAKGSA